jgi:mRNA interferase MazF
MAGRVTTKATPRRRGPAFHPTIPKRFDVYLVSLDPTYGAEIRKTRPCLVVSPDELNDYLATVIIAPMTTVSRPYPSRVDVAFQSRVGQVALDQMRALDKQRLAKRLGTINARDADRVVSTLLELFG